MPLTDAKIKSLKPRDKPYKVTDFGGLYVEVRPTGSRIWRQNYRFGAREKRLTFGAYPALTLADARVARDAAKASLAKGIDPGVEKRSRAEAETSALQHTFSHLADAFQEKARKEGPLMPRRPSTSGCLIWRRRTLDTFLSRTSPPRWFSSASARWKRRGTKRHRNGSEQKSALSSGSLLRVAWLKMIQRTQSLMHSYDRNPHLVLLLPTQKSWEAYYGP